MNTILPDKLQFLPKVSGTKPLSGKDVDSAANLENRSVTVSFPTNESAQLSPQDRVSRITPVAQTQVHTSLPNLFEFGTDAASPLKVQNREQLTEKTHVLIVKYRELDVELSKPGLSAERRESLIAQMQSIQTEYRALIAANEDILQGSDYKQLGFETFKASLRGLSPEMADIVEKASEKNGEIDTNTLMNADTLQQGLNFPIMMMLSNYKYQELDSLHTVLKQIKAKGPEQTQLTPAQNETLKKFGMHFADGKLVNLMTKQVIGADQLTQLSSFSDSLRDAHGPLGNAGLQLHLAELGRVGDIMATALANNQALQDATSQLDELVSQLSSAERHVQGDLVRAQAAGDAAQAADAAVVLLLESLDIVEEAHSDTDPSMTTASSVDTPNSDIQSHSPTMAALAGEPPHESADRQASGFSFRTPEEAERFNEVLRANQVTAQQAPDGKWSYRYNGQVYEGREFRQLFAHSLRTQLRAAQQHAHETGVSFKEALDKLKQSTELMNQLQQQVQTRQVEVRQRQDNVRRSNEELQAEANNPNCPPAVRNMLGDIQQQGQTALERSDRSLEQADQVNASVQTTRNHVADMVSLGERMFGDFRAAIDRAFSKLSAFFSTLNTVLINKVSPADFKKQYRLTQENISSTLNQQGLSQKATRLLQDAKVTLEKYFIEFEQAQKKLASNQETIQSFTQRWGERLASEMNYHKAKLAELDESNKERVKQNN